MSLPRFVVNDPETLEEGALLRLAIEQAKHLNVLRLKPGAALELLFPGGPWKAEVSEISRDKVDKVIVRLVAPLQETRESTIELQACLPVTSHLGTWDEWLPPLVELGVTLFQPIIFARSEYDAKRFAAKRERWDRIILSAVEQSHRTRLPDLREPVSVAALYTWNTVQKWVAYELQTGQPNPTFSEESLAFTCGPEGGITDEEFSALRESGWQAVCLGRSILRAATAPIAIMGAIQFQLNR